MEKTFELKTLKLGVFGGVDCKYKLAETSDDGVVTENEYHVKTPLSVHQDLENLFTKELSAILADIFNTPKIDVWAITPTGIALSGQNDNIGIVITGTIETRIGRVTFKTRRIHYKANAEDFAAKMTVWVDKVVGEAHAFLFENKTAETEVFGE